MMLPAFVSIVIPAYNGLPVLEDCLARLIRQEYPADRYEIIVVDDGSTDHTQEAVARLQSGCPVALRCLRQLNKGPAAARNLGIRHARAEIIAFLDSDCLPEKDWLCQIVRGYAGHPLIAGIGGTIKAAPGSSLVSSYCAFVALNESPAIDENGIAYIITGNASFRKDILLEAGGFDERYDFAGGEDPDICYRIRKSGYTFDHNHKAVVHNSHKDTLGALVKTYFRYGKGWAYLLLRKNASWDLCGDAGKRVLHFPKVMVRIFLMASRSLQLVLRFLKIPLKAALFWGDGLGFRQSIAYAFFDFCRDLAFHHGSLAGYISGKHKGLKRTCPSKEN